MTSTKTLEQRLAAATQKAHRDRDALQAVRDYAAEKARVDANTERLRVLRMEKEAADAKAAAEPSAQKKPRARKSGGTTRPRTSS
jgi:predicted  nucleic acid-binding Zn-ribbon protein